MDYRFFDFLGNYFLHAAKYQKQAQELQTWIDQGGSGFKEIADMFKNFYGVSGDASSDAFNSAFQKFVENYMELFQASPMVSQEKYNVLKQKYDLLKKKCDQQKEIIENLTSLSSMKDAFQDNMSQGIDQVMKNQKEMFEQMMGGFYPKKDDSEQQ